MSCKEDDGLILRRRPNGPWPRWGGTYGLCYRNLIRPLVSSQGCEIIRTAHMEGGHSCVALLCHHGNVWGVICGGHFVFSVLDRFRFQHLTERYKRPAAAGRRMECSRHASLMVRPAGSVCQQRPPRLASTRPSLHLKAPARSCRRETFGLGGKLRQTPTFEPPTPAFSGFWSPSAELPEAAGCKQQG